MDRPFPSFPICSLRPAPRPLVLLWSAVVLVLVVLLFLFLLLSLSSQGGDLHIKRGFPSSTLFDLFLSLSLFLPVRSISFFPFCTRHPPSQILPSTPQQLVCLRPPKPPYLFRYAWRIVLEFHRL